MKNKFKSLKNKQVLESIETQQAFMPELLPIKIMSIRNALGLTQNQMARKLKMKQPPYLRMEKNIGKSGLNKIELIAKNLNCEVLIILKPIIPFSELIRKQATLKAEKILKRTYGNMALEKQSPDKNAYNQRLKELTDELSANPDSSLWED